MTSLVATPDATMASDRVAHITEAQKQALMDNLQLEIADRARKLRAQYALQAQGLRTRLEMRINRIPRNLRKANMGDLLEKHLEAQKKTQQRLPSPNKRKSLKRKSEEAAIADKENTQPASAALANPKKRTKPSPGPTGIPTSPNLARSTRPQALNTTVLSPKSPNSRTLPRSPLKSPSAKSPPTLPRPRGAALQAARPTTKGTLKRPATAPTATALEAVVSAAQPNNSTRRALRASNASAESTSSEKTTIINKSPAKPNPPSRPHTAMALASPKKLPVPTSPAKYNSIREKPLPAPAAAPTPVAGTIKKGTFKSAMASLTGSKKGKKTTAAAAFSTNGTPPPAGRVLRKRAP
ncbi:hypothetical protein KCU95_g9523, partial [Aureobasidium melanogenum]